MGRPTVDHPFLVELRAAVVALTDLRELPVGANLSMCLPHLTQRGSGLCVRGADPSLRLSGEIDRIQLRSSVRAGRTHMCQCADSFTRSVQDSLPGFSNRLKLTDSGQNVRGHKRELAR